MKNNQKIIHKKKSKRKSKKIQRKKNTNLKKYKLLVISMDNENGKERRKVLNYPYTFMKGLKGNNLKNPIVRNVNQKFFSRYNQDRKSSKFNGFVGNFSSHVKCYHYIIKHNLKNTVILEDDSILSSKLPDPSKLPNDSLTLFSGRIQPPKSWKDSENFHKNCTPKKIIKSFKKGVNLIDYDKFRFTQSNAIFVPNKEVAKNVLNHMKKSKHYKSMDLYYSKEKLVKYLYYPAPFTHDDQIAKVGSNILKGKGQGIIKNYVLQIRLMY